jgi:putative zinc finger protein
MPSRAQCEAVLRQLWPFLDGMVSETEREAILVHFEQCADCESHFDFAKAFLEAIAEAKPYLEVEEEMTERVMAALGEAGFGTPD